MCVYARAFVCAARVVLMQQNTARESQRVATVVLFVNTDVDTET